MTAFPHPIPIHDYPVLDSTNAQAKRLAEAGDGGPFVVSAVRQTAGRGRFNRVWHAPENNLAMTIAVGVRQDSQGSSTLPLMTGLAIHAVLQALVGDRASVKIKWPNDVLVDGLKISGTLIEHDGTGFYVGIGINLVSEPVGALYPTISLGRFCDVERMALVDSVAEAWLDRFGRWAENGFAPMAGAYTANLWRIGESITVTLDEARTQQITGRCLGVSAEGLLRLELPDGAVTELAAGDVGA